MTGLISVYDLVGVNFKCGVQSTKAITLAFVLLDFQLAGVRRYHFIGSTGSNRFWRSVIVVLNSHPIGSTGSNRKQVLAI